MSTRSKLNSHRKRREEDGLAARRLPLILKKTQKNVAPTQEMGRTVGMLVSVPCSRGDNGRQRQAEAHLWQLIALSCQALRSRRGKWLFPRRMTKRSPGMFSKYHSSISGIFVSLNVFSSSFLALTNVLSTSVTISSPEFQIDLNHPILSRISDPRSQTHPPLHINTFYLLIRALLDMYQHMILFETYTS